MKRLLFSLFLILFISSAVSAAPALYKSIPEPKELPGKTLQERFAPGIHPRAMLAPNQYPATLNLLFLRVEFQQEEVDDPKTAGNGLWSDQRYWHDSDPDYWVNRAKTKFVEYWNSVSYGLLTITIDVSPQIYHLPKTMTSYGDESDAALQNLIYDSITMAGAEIAFNQYDAVLIVHAGVGEESAMSGTTPNDIWSLYYSGGGNICQNEAGPCLTTLLKDGKVISEAIIMPQTDSRSAPQAVIVDPLGVYVHEFGHWLGLPDLYCTSSVICLNEGPGDWSLMGHGIYNKNQNDPITKDWYGSSPARLDAWSLIQLGWVHPQPVSSNQSMTIAPVASASDAGTAGLNIIKAQASTTTANQYFLVENRQQIGLDAGLPGHGMLVWLVDDDVINAKLASNTMNNNPHRPGLRLIEADGDGALIQGIDHGRSADPFPGSKAVDKLTPVTLPSSVPYTNYGWVNIRDIRESAGSGPETIGFSLGFAPFPPADLVVDDTTRTLTWSHSTGAATYQIYKNGTLIQAIPANGAPNYHDNTLQPTDSIAVTSVDTGGNESQPALRPAPSSAAGSTGGGGGGSKGGVLGGCFIATAAYGSHLDSHVETLRNFRDRYLLTNTAGRAFVALYYQYSPAMADYIGRHEGLRTMTRLALTPVVLAVRYPNFAVMIFILLALAAAWLSGRRSHMHWL